MIGLVERKRRVLAVLREHGGEMTANEIAERTGIPRGRLTGESLGALLLLEVEGAVGRVGKKRWTKWFAL